MDRRMKEVIRSLVDYSWHKEAQDYAHCIEEGDIVPGQGSHIFEDLMLLDRMLRIGDLEEV